ncbi:3'-5' exoribonuclease HELZ2-like [Ptychodera flava]|uniref:3'-5' exoribonuclease HELZ2-like n=1 Tax=Ptychodera flava TaxID=63121 RepID=UPI00396A6C59
MKLQQTNHDLLQQFLSQESTPRWRCTIEVLQKSSPDRRTEETIYKLEDARVSHMVKDICLGQPPTSAVLRTCNLEKVIKETADNRRSGLPRLNDDQIAAIKKSLENQFTVIQGPPGTGKSYTASYLAYGFSIVNSLEGSHVGDKMRRHNRAKVLYCAPSNKAVDVAADYLKHFELKVIRMYSKNIEGHDFKIHGWTNSKHRKQGYQAECSPANRSIALHHVIRSSTSKYGKRIREFDKTFSRSEDKVSKKDYDEYRSLIQKAEMEALGCCDIILCTCSEAASKRLRDVNIGQCIIDEAGMSTEPETLVPLVRTNPAQIILIGDHRQLQPIVSHNLSKQLGLAISLLERYCDVGFFFRLKTQYRMHREICAFPNQQFYNNDLRTADIVEKRMGVRHQIDEIWPGGRDFPMVLCDVVGKEVTSSVTTEEGNEQSKKNLEEVKEIVRITKMLTGRYGVYQSRLQILSQYNSQCFEIKQELRKAGCQDVGVSSVIGFQGSEKDYILLSTVRSLPWQEIEDNPTKGWLKANLGFVTDEHQTNVALTRARRGLIIVGNKNLLKTDTTWGALIKHYEERNCIVKARDFPSVHQKKNLRPNE